MSCRAECLHKLFRHLHQRWSLLPYLFNQSFNNVDLWIFHTLSYNPVLYFLAQSSPALLTGSSFSWSLCPLTPPPPSIVGGWVFFFFFLSTSLLSGTTGYSRLIVYISDPSLRISLSSKEPWFLLLENIIRNQYLGGRFAHCC